MCGAWTCGGHLCFEPKECRLKSFKQTKANESISFLFRNKRFVTDCHFFKSVILMVSSDRFVES